MKGLVPVPANDHIEREMLVAAPIPAVWELVSAPGWWIGDGEPDHRTIQHEEARTVVDFPPHGRFPVIVVETDPMTYICFRCGDNAEDIELTDSNSTLVEFFLTQVEDGTNLKVRESGFAAYMPDPDDRARAIEDNTEGWKIQLGWVQQQAEDAA